MYVYIYIDLAIDMNMNMNMDMLVTHPCLQRCMYMCVYIYVFIHHYDILSIAHLQSSSVTNFQHFTKGGSFSQAWMKRKNIGKHQSQNQGCFFGFTGPKNHP